MKHTTTVTMAFEAGHQLDEPAACRWPGHGHRWTISVSVEGGLDPAKMYVVDHFDLLAAVAAVVGEFAGHSLNDMLPGVRTTPEGLALYVHERLVLRYRISAIEVTMGDNIRSRVEWEQR